MISRLSYLYVFHNKQRIPHPPKGGCPLRCLLWDEAVAWAREIHGKDDEELQRILKDAEAGNANP